jgi:hypothetical protein
VAEKQPPYQKQKQKQTPYKETSMTKLIETLVNKNFLSEGTVITINVPAIAMNGTYFETPKDMMVTQVITSDEKPTMVISDRLSTMTITLDTEILAIDGMDLDRYADAHDIKADGDAKSIGKRRGRKPFRNVNR